MSNSSKLTKVYFVSLGCPKNLVDSERILGSLEKSGAVLTNSLSESNIVVINTCGFIKPALIETGREIKRILKAKNKKTIYVYGCAVNRARESLMKKFPEIDNWYYLEEREKLTKAITGQRKRTDSRLVTTHGYAYLKIADGCSNHCSYCIIPQIKGEYRSLDMEFLVNEGNALAELGFKELILIAQDTARYGMDLYGKPMLVPLLKKLSKIKKIRWLRILYAHPRYITGELIKEIKTNEKICKYLDMPIQHINDRLLSLMNRNISKCQIIDILNQLKGITLRTTVMVGFPTETANAFAELYNFLDKGYFDWFGVFRYHREPGTPAASLKSVPADESRKRLSKILQLQRTLIRRKNTQRINKYYSVLIHKKNFHFIGHAEFSAPEIDGQIIVKKKALRIGEFYDLRINRIEGADLYAE